MHFRLGLVLNNYGSVFVALHLQYKFYPLLYMFIFDLTVVVQKGSLLVV